MSGRVVAPGSGDISSFQRSHSVLAISMAIGEPEGPAVPDAREERHLVALEAHPRASSVAEPSPGELVLDHLGRDREPRRGALDDDDQPLAVALPRGQEPEHRGGCD